MSAQVASDLKGFGSRAWVRGLLADPTSPTYFGKVKFSDDPKNKGGMAEWKRTSANKLTPKQLDDVADFVASFAHISPDLTPEEWLTSPGVSDHPGLKPFQENCLRCHGVAGLGEAGGERDAPQLFGWGSTQWISRMIHKPGAPDLYGFLESNAQMPSFADQLTDNDVTTLIRFLKGDYLGGSATAVSSSSPASAAK
jgi:ubiquinol-cytochrome c reductase cytochrome b subunit